MKCLRRTAPLALLAAVVGLALTWSLGPPPPTRATAGQPGPGETKVLHVTLRSGRKYTVYSTNPDDGKRVKKMTLSVK